MREGEHAAAWRAAASWIAGCAVLLCSFAAPAGGHPELAEVRAALDERLAVDPEDPELLIHQGRLRADARDFDGALVSLAHALAHGGDPATVGAARAQVLLEAGQPRLASLEYDRLLALRPHAFDLLFERGRAKLALGDVAAADRDFRRAIANMPAPRPEHVVVHAQAWLKLGERQEALRALDEGMTRTGPLPSLQLTAIDLELDLERYDRALARLDLLLEQTPNNEAWIARRADILQRAGRVDEARAERAHSLARIEARLARRRSRATDELAARLRSQIEPGATANEGKP